MANDNELTDEQVEQAADEIAQRLEQQQATKPIVDTVILNQLVEADVPLRGQMREEFLRRLRNQIRQRRTVHGISNMIARTAISPLTNLVQDQLEQTLSNQIKQQLQKIINE